MQDLVRISAPATTPVSLAELKLSLRVEDTAEDTLLGLHLAAAVGMVDGPTGELKRALISQTWRAGFECFPCGPIELPLRPLLSVASIQYRDRVGVLQTMPFDDYVVHDGELAMIEPAPGLSWPDAPRGRRSVLVTFNAGYGADPADVPGEIRAAILLMCGDLYANRETGVIGTVSADIKMSTTVRILLSSFWVPPS